MFEFLNRFFSWIRNLFWHQEMEITIIGLQKAGKTSLVSIIAKDVSTNTIPTVGFNMRKITHDRTILKIWDLGGERRFRGMWERYCRGVNAILYMVDAADTDRIEESAAELHLLQLKPQLQSVPILVLGNKTDLADALTESELIARMQLEKIENREVCCYMISCKSRDNVDKVLQWLIKHSNSTS